MKKLNSAVLMTLFLVLVTATTAFSQAKKPTLMVVPSDAYCAQRGYTMVFDNQGIETVVPDYQKALREDSDLRLVIVKLGEMMTDRGFPLKVLEAELKSLQNTNAEINMMQSSSGAAVAESPIDLLKRTAKADIILDLDFTMHQQGPRKYITFILQGLDAYTNKQVAAASGTGEPSVSAIPQALLEEAVLSHIENFNGQLQDHFNDMFANGREVKIRIQVWDSSPVDLEEEYDINGESLYLEEVIDDWFADNTVEGRFSFSDGSENFMLLEQVRIPLYDERDRAMDTRRYLRDLRKYLGGEPFNLPVDIYTRGLGEAWLTIGEK